MTVDVTALLNAFCEVSWAFAPQFQRRLPVNWDVVRLQPVCVSVAPFKHQAEAKGRLGPVSTPGL